MIEYLLALLNLVTALCTFGYILQVIYNVYYLLTELKFESKREFLLSITPIYIFILIYRKLKQIKGETL